MPAGPETAIPNQLGRRANISLAGAFGRKAAAMSAPSSARKIAGASLFFHANWAKRCKTRGRRTVPASKRFVDDFAESQIRLASAFGPGARRGGCPLADFRNCRTAKDPKEISRADPVGPEAQRHGHQPSWQAGRLSATQACGRDHLWGSAAPDRLCPACRSRPTAVARIAVAKAIARSAMSSPVSPTRRARCFSRPRSSMRSRAYGCRSQSTARHNSGCSRLRILADERSLDRFRQRGFSVIALFCERNYLRSSTVDGASFSVAPLGGVPFCYFSARVD